LEPSEDLNYGVKDSILHCDGAGSEYLYMKGGGSLNPPTHETVDLGYHTLYQDGKTVFKEAVKGMADISAEIMEKNNLSSDDISYLVPHQANLRIIDATANRMGIPKEKAMVNIHKFGNTTAATIPLCLTEYYREGKLKKGDNLILAAFGAGFTWGSIYLTWGID
jgi:3-oxoacyl-[acyl-carrier-protein] synthase III